MAAKKIIVTGTSRGIGFELVKQLADQGHEVLALSRNKKPVENLQLSKVHAFSCDINNAGELQEVHQFISTNWKQVDVLIHNAGKLIYKPFLEINPEEWEEAYQTNVFGVVKLTQLVLPFMSKAGHVLSVSSMGGVQGSVKFSGLSAYSSSKGALITLTEVLAEEYKETGPSFNVAALGAVQTEMFEEAFPGGQAPISAEGMARYLADLALTGHQYYNGKLLQVSNSTP